MKRVRVRCSVVVAALMAIIGALLGISASPALAAPLGNELCLTSANYCLNDWGGSLSSGNPVNMYQPNVGNEFFTLDRVHRCDSAGTVTATADGDATNCPFGNPVFDTRYRGFAIVQIGYDDPDNTQKCVATASNGQAILGKCNDSAGYNGDNGTIFIDHNGYLINLYWSNNFNGTNNARCMTGGTGNGDSVTLNLPTTSGCPVWGNYDTSVGVATWDEAQPYDYSWTYNVNEPALQACVRLEATGDMTYTVHAQRSPQFQTIWYTFTNQWLYNPTITATVSPAGCSGPTTVSDMTLTQNWSGYSCSFNPSMSVGAGFPWGVSAGVSGWPNCGQKTVGSSTSPPTGKSGSVYHQYNPGSALFFPDVTTNPSYTPDTGGPCYGVYVGASVLVGTSWANLNEAGQNAQELCLDQYN